MITLGIESSCDDTAVAVLEDDSRLLANLVSGQDNIHERFGGVVPELASRNHLLAIQPLVSAALDEAEKSLDDIDLVAATQGPGLIGSLLVGFSYAKAISYVQEIPLVGVDHMTGHLLSTFLEDERPQFPYIALIVSGGTSSLFRCDDYTEFHQLGRTRDDAAGEAFDKVSKLLELGYPGGPRVSKKAENGDPHRFNFPRAWLQNDSLDFSFSGLKTAVRQCFIDFKSEKDAPFIDDICASFQEAIVDVLTEKTILAAKKYNIPTIVLGGGVSANSRLRQVMKNKCEENRFSLYLPSLPFCTDNGAMVALAGYYKYIKTKSLLDYGDDVFSRSVFN